MNRVWETARTTSIQLTLIDTPNRFNLGKTSSSALWDEQSSGYASISV